MTQTRWSSPFTRRHFLISAGALSVGGLLAACAPAAAPAQPQAASGGSADVNWLLTQDVAELPPTIIRYWYFETPERIELGKQQEAAFEQMYPNIQVEGSTAPEATDNEMLVAFIKAGTNSHVHQSVNMEDTWYFSRDLLLPLEDLPGFSEVWERMNPKLNYTWKDGHVYSISWYSGPMMIFYNGQRVRAAGLNPEQLPETHSQFLEWAEALSGDGNWFINLSPAEEWWRWQFTAYPFYIAATGSNQLVSEDGKNAVFNTEQAAQSYDLIHTLFANGYNLTEVLEGNPFFSGQVAANLAGSSMLANTKRNAPPDFELLVGPVPKPDDSTVEGFPTYNFVRNFALMREQDKQGGEADQVNRAAWEFMKYLLSPEQLAADFAATGNLPPTNDLLTNPLYTEILNGFPAADKYATFADNSYVYDMNTTVGSEIMGILTKSYLDLIFDQQDSVAALTAAETAVNELLAKS
jgi:ABC-type glycerol-3-phosphate transport system substrate-binding protein